MIRLVRRVCILREQGRVADANRLQAGELAAAIAAYRLWHGPGSLTEQMVCAMFMSETELIREAMVIAEVVAPDLAAMVPAGGSSSAPVFPPIRPLGSLKPFPDQPPAIGELLDAMLAAEPPEAGPAQPADDARA